ncbi:hypothetical protein ACIBH1_24780 [Nonomuraea sp. NPDC050663]|uniref:hypothetical protein n=1 Tax=Nonomuraea sp. NPDC050663 TaxID=3364370 RepID=UPI0037BA433E
MTTSVFSCKNCGALVTAPIREVPFPDRKPNTASGEAQPRVTAGSFARDPKPFGPPYVPEGPGARTHVPAGPAFTVLVHPDDVRSLRLHADPGRLNGCCGYDGVDGPNLVCEGCGAEIATEQNDCWVTWHDIRLEPAAVTELPGGTTDPP